MKLVAGGVYQGKLQYVLERFQLTAEDVYRCSVDRAVTPSGKKVIYELDKWVLARIESGLTDEQELLEIVSSFTDEIIICNDISSGVVPVEVNLRLCRDQVGRVLAILANKSDEVVRLFCGIPMRLK